MDNRSKHSEVMREYKRANGGKPSTAEEQQLLLNLASHEHQIEGFKRTIADAEQSKLHPHDSQSVARADEQIAWAQAAIVSQQGFVASLRRTLGLTVDELPAEPVETTEAKPAKGRRRR
jgi:hypothetical protein